MRRWAKVVGLGVIGVAVATAVAGLLWFSLYDYTFAAARTRLVYEDVERFESVIARLPFGRTLVAELPGRGVPRSWHEGPPEIPGELRSDCETPRQHDRRAPCGLAPLVADRPHQGRRR